MKDNNINKADFVNAELILDKKMSLTDVCTSFKSTFGLTLRFYEHLSVAETGAGRTRRLNELNNQDQTLLIKAYEKVIDVERKISDFYKIPVHIASANDFCLLDADLRLGEAWRW